MADFVGTSYGDVTTRVGIYAVGKALAHAEPMIVLAKLGSKIQLSETMPMNKGKTISWIRPIPFTADTTELTEGVAPPPQTLRTEKVEATIKQYGKIVKFTDHIYDVQEDPILSWASMLLTEQMVNTIELLTWAELRTATNVLYANGSSVSAVNTPIDGDILDAATRTLEQNHGKRITKKVLPSANYATAPIRPCYVYVGHSDQRYDIERLPGYVPKESYANGGADEICEAEIGSRGDVRFVLSPQLIPRRGAGSATTNGMVNSSSAVDVYTGILFAHESYATVYLKGMSGVPRIVVRNPKQGVVGDELGQSGAVSAKYWFVAKILNNSWLVRIEAGVTLLS